MIAVVAGIVVREERIMLCQRKPQDRLALKWEFPGGKLEPGESPEQALERELMEELCIRTRTGRVYDACRRMEENADLLILFYRSRILEGDPRPVECNDIAWVAPADLLRYALAPADAQVARRILREGL